MKRQDYGNTKAAEILVVIYKDASTAPFAIPESEDSADRVRKGARCLREFREAFAPLYLSSRCDPRSSCVLKISGSVSRGLAITLKGDALVFPRVPFTWMVTGATLSNLFVSEPWIWWENLRL